MKMCRRYNKTTSSKHLFQIQKSTFNKDHLIKPIFSPNGLQVIVLLVPKMYAESHMKVVSYMNHRRPQILNCNILIFKTQKEQLVHTRKFIDDKLTYLPAL